MRASDERASEVVNNFMQKFYDNNTTNFKRYFDKLTQVKGIDVSFTFNGVDYKCDEKAAVRWMNIKLNTFALELEFINRGNKLQTGWFLNEDLDNNSYMFIYTDKVAGQYDSFTEEDIKECTIILVRKERIQEYLDSIGWTTKRIKDKCDMIRDYEGFCTMRDEKIRFCYSEQLVEKPINLLIDRQKLIELSDYWQIMK